MTLINPGQLDPDSSIIMVSGVYRSIGAAVAARLHAEGNSLTLAARDPSGIPKTASEKFLNCHFDAQDPESPQAWAKETQARVGRIDGLINNALIFAVPVNAVQEPLP